MVSRTTTPRTVQIVKIAALFMAAGLVSITGFFGGAVVYGVDNYAW